MKLLLHLLLFIAAVLPAGSLRAQLNNAAFSDAVSWQPDAEGKLVFSLTDLGYMQNNEYFDSTADGYTLFGNQFHPRLSYYALPNVRIDAGVFLRNDFGQSGFVQVQPTFALTVKADSLTFIFGNINNSLSHNLIQPMYNFEKVIHGRLESGAQFLYKRNWWTSDLWVDWQAMEYYGSNYHERIFGGFSSRATLVNNNRFRCFVPFQLTAYHNGGQIDTSKAGQFTQMSAALGLGMEWKNTEGSFLQGISTENYMLGQNTNSFVIPHTYKNGGGLFANLTFKTKWFSVMGSYWYGQQYMNLKGGYQYQSLNQTYNPNGIAVEGKLINGTTNRHRHITFIRIMRDFNIAEGITITTRLEPLYNQEAAAWEYSYGVFFNFKTDFLLGTLKKLR